MDTLPGEDRVVAHEPAAGPSDEELVERVRRGDAQSFELLVTRHMKRAFAIGYRLLGQREDAEDLVQDAFIAALQKIDTFREGARFGPWFYRIVVNRGLNSRKSRSLRHTEALPEALTARTPSPLREAERGELRELLTAAMARLTERQREIVQLFEIDGFTSPEIADMLDMPDGTVRWHLHEARQALREALSPLEPRRT